MGRRLEPLVGASFSFIFEFLAPLGGVIGPDGKHYEKIKYSDDYGPASPHCFRKDIADNIEGDQEE